MIKFVSHPSITRITSYILQSLFPGHWRHGDSGWEEARKETFVILEITNSGTETLVSTWSCGSNRYREHSLFVMFEL